MEEQCQVMKTNSMQCDNLAFVLLNGVGYCLLHLNDKLNKNIEAKVPVTLADFELAKPTDENKVLLDRAINFTNDSINNAT